ncbi:hypothetical protein BGP_6589 [Beggiatoa sp. PS]|nr:hypothetical protein BGP_6589 [Beggiatoa sp. PS]
MLFTMKGYFSFISKAIEVPNVKINFGIHIDN